MGASASSGEGDPPKRRGLATLRRRFQRRRRAAKGTHDTTQVFRDLICEWSARDVASLVEEYDATAALKEVALQAEAARPPASSCKRDLGVLFHNRWCSDLNLIYQGVVFGVHRAILGARCPFFREMLHSLSSACSEVAVDIDIAGVSTSVFGELLRYLYTGELHDVPPGSLLMQLSDQFGIPNPLDQDLKYLLETGVYSDVALSFTSACDHTDTTEVAAGGGGGCGAGCPASEFWCHRAILCARSPFFRSVLLRQPHRRRILLDDNVIPRRFACVLLRALYGDGVELHPASVEEAMQLFEVARFIEVDALVHSCEDFLVEQLSLDVLGRVLAWSDQPHGSQWVHRQAVHFMREEFVAVAASPLLLQLDRDTLLELISSDFLQAGELEVLQAVLKWGEHQLFKRVEEREPNLVSHTAHSVSRRGVRRRDLCDGELRDLLGGVLECVRAAHVLDGDVLASCVRRGLLSTPPPHMLPDEPAPKGPRAWVRGRGSGLYVKPRLFTPFVDEAKAWLDEQLGGDAECVRAQAWHMSAHIPDALYMVEPPHLCPPPPPPADLVLDECVVRAMKQREKELRGGGGARRAYAVVRNHCDVTRLLQLRVVREFGLPDRAMEMLHRTPHNPLLHHHHKEQVAPPRGEPQMMPDVALATSLLEQMRVGDEPPSSSSSSYPPLRMF